MSKVYFSNESTKGMDEWDDTGGILKVFIYPKNVFSINGWKMAFMFMRDFSCSFLSNTDKEDV